MAQFLAHRPDEVARLPGIGQTTIALTRTATESYLGVPWEHAFVASRYFEVTLRHLSLSARQRCWASGQWGRYRAAVARLVAR